MVPEIHPGDRLHESHVSGASGVIYRLAAYELIGVVESLEQQFFIVAVGIMRREVHGLKAQHIFIRLFKNLQKQVGKPVIAQQIKLVQRESPHVAAAVVFKHRQPVAGVGFMEVGFGGVGIRRRETEGRVPDHVRLQDIGHLRQLAHAEPAGEHAEQVGGTLVLQHVDAVSERDHAASASEDIA